MQGASGFEVGDVVRSKTDGRRGVVAGFDEKYMGTDEWYEERRLSFDRERPWYHVLVHGNTQSAYVAEENLAADDSGEQVMHPLVKGFFKTFRKGRYVVR